MRQRDIANGIRFILRRVGPNQRPYVLSALVVLVVACSLLAPVWEQYLEKGLSDDATKTQPTPTDHSAPPRQHATKPRPSSSDRNKSGERAILEAFRDRRSNLQVTGSAIVKKLLPDDRLGDRHQKMILSMPSGHTLLLAHNLDLADRIPAKVGDRIEFAGEYEYSEQGGVLHWTHHDPRGSHPDGWIKHRGTTYR